MAGHVVGASRTKANGFAEGCAVVAETEIRTKNLTDRPNVNVCNLDKKPISYKDGKTKEWSIGVERSTMRTKAASIKSDEVLPVYDKAPEKDVMKEGVNLRGEKAMVMFDRNFRRSRLGYAPKTAVENARSNIEVIEGEHRKNGKGTK